MTAATVKTSQAAYDFSMKLIIPALSACNEVQEATTEAWHRVSQAHEAIKAAHNALTTLTEVTKSAADSISTAVGSSPGEHAGW